MAVLVLAAAVVVPGLPAYARSAHLRGTALRLASMVRYAGDWSAGHNRALALGYDPEQRAFTLGAAEETGEEALAAPLPEEGDDTADEPAPEVDAEHRFLRLPEDVSLSGGESQQGERLTEGGSIRFLPDGSADEATVVLGAAQQSWTVRVGGRRGRVTLEAGDALEEGLVGHSRPAK